MKPNLCILLASIFSNFNHYTYCGMPLFCISKTIFFYLSFDKEVYEIDGVLSVKKITEKVVDGF